MAWAGMSCSEEEPCPVYLEVTAAEGVGNQIFATGNLHSDTVTLYSVLLRSQDAGKTWREGFERVRGAGLDHIQFADFVNGWASGETLFPLPQDPFLLITADGGKTWRRQPIFDETQAGSIQQFFFSSKNEGSLIVDHGVVAYDTREPTIRAMLDLAQANRWNAIKVTGDKEFQRRVWIEAQARGMAVTLHSNKLFQRAYQPCPDDFKIVAKLKEARGLGNQIEASQPLRGQAAPQPAAGAASADGRAQADAPSRPKRETARQREERYRTAIAAVDGYLATKGVAENVREAIRNLAKLELIERDAAGRPARASVVDLEVPARATPAPERSREVDREPTMTR